MAAVRPRGGIVPLALQLSSFVLVLGMSDAIVGVLWPSMRHDLRLPLADLGLLSLSGSALYVAGGLAGDRVRSAITLGNTVLLACLLAVASYGAWAAARLWAVVLVAFGALGLSKGVLDAVVNAEAAVDGGMRRLGLIHAGWAVGGTLGPLVVAAVLVTSGDWRVAVAVAGAACLVVVVPLAFLDRTRPSALGRAGGATPTARLDGAGEASTLSKPRRRAALAGIVLANVAYVAAESAPIAWGYTYLTGGRHLGHVVAAAAVAGFWAGLTVGRLALAAIGDRFDGGRLLAASCLLAVAGALLLWLLPGAASVAGFPIAGLGCAVYFPVLVALTPKWVGTEHTGPAVGIAVAVSALGGPLAISLFGLLAERLGVGVLGPCIAGAALLLLAVNHGVVALVRRVAL